MPGLYERQRQLQLDVPTSITVAGIGGIGTWVAIDSAMSGVSNLYLFDPDVLEEHNLNRLPFCSGGLNQPKVEVVKNYINAIRPEANVVSIREKLEGILLQIQLGVSSFILDCTDSPKSQVTLYNACKSAGVPFIRAGYDGTHITVTSVVSGWIKNESEGENYTIRPSWVVPASIVAALAVGKMMKYFNQEVNLDIGEIGTSVTHRPRRLTASCETPTRRRR